MITKDRNLINHEMNKTSFVLGYNVVNLNNDDYKVLDNEPLSSLVTITEERARKLYGAKYARVEYKTLAYAIRYVLKDTINDMKNILGNNREISISREITKKYEETIRGTLSDILGKIKEIKGEFVLVVSGNNENESIDDISIEDHINMYINNGESSMNAIKMVAKERNMKKNEVYSIYQSMKGNDK